MKRYLRLVLAVSCLFWGFAEDGKSKKDPTQSFAVVELFTSEGCSSCPPADVLLGEIAKNADANNQPIFALSFHVDYWDFIGWKDPYASRAFSDRQRKYASAFNTSRIYTPQMIVNGRVEFVGSNRKGARESIESALKKEADVQLELTLEKNQSNKLTVEYNLSKLPKNTVLNLALVERGLVQQVKRGENSGRTLKHENVVRSIQTLNLKRLQGSVYLDIPAEVNLEKSSVIGFIQNDYTMEVLGANAIAL